MTDAWHTRDVAKIAYRLGQGEISKSIAADYYIHPSRIRQLKSEWGLVGMRSEVVAVRVDPAMQRRLKQIADKIGIDSAEWLRRVCACAIKDNMYDSITDGEFDVDI